MAIQPILQDGDPVLRQIAIPVPQELFGTPELDQMIADMADTLDTQPDGVALAAPQIGISYRMFIVRYDRTLAPDQIDETATNSTSSTPGSASVPEPKVGVFINPEFIRSSRRRTEVDEGCLSVRGLYGTTYRHERATVRAQTATGEFFERGGGGLMAQIYQHETDHLDGILFIDHALEIGPSKSKIAGEESETMTAKETHNDSSY